MNVKNPGPRVLRWIELEKYEYEVVYREGALNTNADALSRSSSPNGEKGTPEKKRKRVR